jgi:hypothetical protein
MAPKNTSDAQTLVRGRNKSGWIATVDRALYREVSRFVFVCIRPMP